MATLYRQGEFNVAAGRLWRTLVDWGGIADWFPRGFIDSLEIEGEGDGAVRIINAPGGARILERLDGADADNLILQLSIVDPLPDGLLYYKATGRIEPLDERSCRLVWASAFKAADPAGEETFEKWFTLAVKSMFEGLATYLAESGED